MPRPERLDPRSPEAPVRYDDPQLDTRRSRITLAELLAVPEVLAWATQQVAYVELDLPEIPPERMAELRAKRDQILARIREQGGLDGG